MAANNKKLIASVLDFVDFGAQYPGSVLGRQIGLDVRAVQGSVSIGKKILLSGPDAQEELEIVGIELLSNPRDRSVVRIHCSKPMKLVIPDATLEGWTIEER